MLFQDLGLIQPILQAIEEEGYSSPTPIQEKAIPIVLKGKDLMACAQTGTGKTAAFAIPIIQTLYNKVQKTGTRSKLIKALVLTPTRELAIQVAESFSAYGRHADLRFAVIYGGVPQRPQEAALHRGLDILVATPGRLLDLMGQGFVKLNEVEVFVLDEADRMLDMGFVHDVKKVIAKLPLRRQNLLFSATMANEVTTLANTFLHAPERVEVTPGVSTAELIDQELYFVHAKAKRDLLLHILDQYHLENALVFTRTKHGANKLVKSLEIGRAHV